MRLKYNHIIFFISILILAGQIPVSGVMVWEDDFTSSEEWIFHSYEHTSGGTDSIQIDPGMEIADGILTAPNYDTWSPQRIHIADHPSTMVYGNWSFDYLIPEDKIFYDSFNFIFTDLATDYNFTGTVESESDFSGYFLIINAGTDAYRIGKWLGQGGSDYVTILNSADRVGEIITGWHHVDFIRESDVDMAFYLDKVNLLNASDATYTSSERFSWASFTGDSAIDNLMVSDWTVASNPSDSDTSDTSLPLYILPVSVLVILLRKKNNLK